MKYEVILFDADETLFDFHHSERHAFAQTMRSFGFEYDEVHHLQAYQAINAAIWKEFEEGRITQQVLKVERFCRYAAHIHASFDPTDFAHAYEGNLGNACFLLAGSAEVIGELYGKHRMAIITNGLKRVQEMRIAKSPIASYFEAIVISEAVGVSKPDPAIFNLTLAQLHHADRKTTLMVGDSLTSDILGGIRAGLDTCWYNPAGLPGRSDIRPTHEIRTLSELLPLLDAPFIFEKNKQTLDGTWIRQ